MSLTHFSSKEKSLLRSKFYFNSFIAVKLEVQPYLLTSLKDPYDVAKQIGEFTEYLRATASVEKSVWPYSRICDTSMEVVMKL